MKWKIDDIYDDIPLNKAANIILGERLENLLRIIKEFFINESVENLHDIRIALRRLRYNLELFYCCFDKKKFLTFYKNIESLQDLSGLVRDLDVLKENIHSLSAEKKIRNELQIINKVDEKSKDLREKLKLQLMAFFHSKSTKYFKDLLSNKEKL